MTLCPQISRGIFGCWGVEKDFVRPTKFRKRVHSQIHAACALSISGLQPVSDGTIDSFFRRLLDALFQTFREGDDTDANAGMDTEEKKVTLAALISQLARDSHTDCLTWLGGHTLG